MASARRDTTLGDCVVLERAVSELDITCWINKIEVGEMLLCDIDKIDSFIYLFCHTAAYINE